MDWKLGKARIKSKIVHLTSLLHPEYFGDLTLVQPLLGTHGKTPFGQSCCFPCGACTYTLVTVSPEEGCRAATLLSGTIRVPLLASAVC